MQALLNLVWEHLLPALGPGPLPGREHADAALAERLAQLALPAAGRTAPMDRAGDWSAAAFTPYGGVCADQPGLTAVTVTEGADGWMLTFDEGGPRLDVRLGREGWTVGEEPLPTAVSGGWTGADILAVDVVFLETPHRLAVTCSLTDGTFTARWATAPLHGGPLHSLRAPRR